MKTTGEVLAAFPEEVLQRFDFSRAQYHGALSPMTGIICEKHGEFSQYPAQLRKNGATCPECGKEQRIKSKTHTTGKYLSRVKEVHGDLYDYGQTRYQGMAKNVTVICKKHGPFKITAANHLYRAQGCPVCGAEKRGKRFSDVNVGQLAAATSIKKHASLFEKRARQVHGDTYDYSKVQYKGMRSRVEIVCPEHGSFFQRPDKHLLRKQGCPMCGQKSKNEEAVANFLSVFTQVERRNRSLIGPKELDIYLPEHKLAIEYCGMYWHSHTSVEDEKQNKHKHYCKHVACAEQGVRLITVYESEWLENAKQVKRLLRNAIGKGRGKLMARKCDLVKVSAAQARKFYDRYHPQGGAGSGEHFALLWNGKIVACMRFTFGNNDRGDNAGNAVWTLSRYATRVNVNGGASRLFKAFVDEHRPQKVKSFSDNRYFDGNMYERLGFVLDADVAPDYQVWSQKLGLLPKPHYQRRNLPKRLRDHGVEEHFDPDTDPRSEREMTYFMGARRIYDCGKKRWVWTPPA